MAKDKAAQHLGHRGGKQRWRGIPAAERSAIMRRVILARWAKRPANRKTAPTG
jgi:hypothetical protein